MNHGLKPAHFEAILDVLRKHPRVDKVILFGSRAMGTFTRESDVDMCLVGNGLTLSDQAALLAEMGKLPVPQTVDLVLEAKIEAPDFLEHVRKEGKTVFDRGHAEANLGGAGGMWREYPLSELCEAVVDCPHSTPVWSTAGFTVLRSHNIRGGRLDLSDCSYTDRQHFTERTRRATPRVGDLVITREAPMGEVCMLPAGLECCLGQRMVLLRPSAGKVDGRFLLYAMQGARVQEQIRWNEGTGSTVSNLRIPVLQALCVPVPPLGEQRTIARILGALDDKVELNRKMNATLEAMARALFKSWFVEKPADDWHTAPLAEWVEVLSGGTPSKSNAALWGGPLKWISPKAMTSIHADECDEHVSDQAVGNGTRIAPKGSTLVMVRGMGLHDGVRVSQAREDVTFNQDVKALVPKNIEADLLLFALLDAQADLHKRVETSGHGTGKMPSEILLAHPITMPSRDEQRRRGVHISVLNDRIAANRDESKTLVRIRDGLLPRLLSGELSVARAERTVEEVA